MKAMILAAGRGERLRPLTDQIPKPLIPIAGKPLIVYHLEKLKQAGFKEVVINVSYRAQEIMDVLGKGENYGIKITYSIEPEVGGLETGGGIFRALPLLSDPFIVVNSDIWTDFPFQNLKHPIEVLAHLVLVNNPSHNPDGDFYLKQSKIVAEDISQKLTFSGMGIYQKALFKNCQDGKFKLASVLYEAIKQQQISGEHYQGIWQDVGSYERLTLTEKLAT